ncbi:MAG: AAA family ATPase [Candidatus Acidiferrales bacterium]
MEAVIFVGMQGAGKSTFYREQFFDTHVRISLDMLRTRKREQQLVAACLDAGQSFVIDNTNPKASDRARYLEAARAKGFRVIAYFFDVPLRDAMERNNERQLRQKIPAVAVAGTHKKLERPSKKEGFDQIFTVRVPHQGGFAVTEDA